MSQQIRTMPVEPAFDVPPFFAGVRDRRMGGRAAARWTMLRGEAAMPQAARYAADAETLAGPASHDMVLDLSDALVVRVDHAGSEVDRAFGVTAGLLVDGGAGSLARTVLAAVASARQRPALVPFEALIRGAGHATATFLTRGVLLPLADPRGRLAAAHVVVTWKEQLSIEQNRALERELRVVLADFAAAGRLNVRRIVDSASVCH